MKLRVGQIDADRPRLRQRWREEGGGLVIYPGDCSVCKSFAVDVDTFFRLISDRYKLFFFFNVAERKEELFNSQSSSA